MISARRDISSVLKLLFLVLLLLVIYHAWLKPAYWGSNLPPAQPSETVPSRPSEQSIMTEIQKSPSWDVPPSRLAELSSAPNALLGSIRDEIERGNYVLAEQRLRKLTPRRVGNAAARQYVSALWNNLGVQQERYGGSELSVKAFRQAVAWDHASALAHLNLTQAYWELRDRALTPQFLETVIRLAPQEPFPHLALADLLLAEGKIALAAMHVSQARSRAERDPNHQSYLRLLTERIEKATSVRTAALLARRSIPPAQPHSPSSPTPEETHLPTPSIKTTAQQPPSGAWSDSSSSDPLSRLKPGRFTVQFDGPADFATWTRMRAILEYAHDEFSRKFGHVPSKPIGVVLHTKQPFMSASGSPAWADTLFDQATGSIHLPTQEALEDLAQFSRIARHQFAHALLHEYMNGATAAVPGWLIEGLAILLAEDSWADFEDDTRKDAPFVSIQSLQGDWRHLAEKDLPMAYLAARAATQHFVDRYSMYGVRQLFKLLRGGRSFDSAMREQYAISYDQFQRQWEQAQRAVAASKGS